MPPPAGNPCPCVAPSHPPTHLRQPRLAHTQAAKPPSVARAAPCCQGMARRWCRRRGPCCRPGGEGEAGQGEQEGGARGAELNVNHDESTRAHAHSTLTPTPTNTPQWDAHCGHQVVSLSREGAVRPLLHHKHNVLGGLPRQLVAFACTWREQDESRSGDVWVGTTEQGEVKCKQLAAQHASSCSAASANPSTHPPAQQQPNNRA